MDRRAARRVEDGSPAEHAGRVAEYRAARAGLARGATRGRRARCRRGRSRRARPGVAGVDHVGLGGDYDGMVGTPDGLEGVDVPGAARRARDAGWSDADLAKLTWHNAVRVLRDTEAAARAAQAERGPSLATFA